MTTDQIIECVGLFVTWGILFYVMHLMFKSDK